MRSCGFARAVFTGRSRKVFGVAIEGSNAEGVDYRVSISLMLGTSIESRTGLGVCVVGTCG